MGRKGAVKNIQRNNIFNRTRNRKKKKRDQMKEMESNAKEAGIEEIK
jgi:hypothetical protein